MALADIFKAHTFFVTRVFDNPQSQKGHSIPGNKKNTKKKTKIHYHSYLSTPIAPEIFLLGQLPNYKKLRFGAPRLSFEGPRLQGTEAWIHLGHNDDRMPGLSFMGDDPTKMEVEIEMFFFGGGMIVLLGRQETSEEKNIGWRKQF